MDFSETAQASSAASIVMLPRASWRCSGATNTELVQNLKAGGFVTREDVAGALEATDRALYAPPLPLPNHRVSNTYHYGAYADAPQAIGFKATISAPHHHALTLETLYKQITTPGSRTLDVGCGSGVTNSLPTPSVM